MSIHADAQVHPDAVIRPGAEIGPGAVIEPGAVIGSRAVVGARAWIELRAWIEPGAEIEPGVVIGPRAVIGKNRKGVTRALVLNGLGETRQMTAHDSTDGLIIVIGCMGDYAGLPPDEARAEIAKKYPPTHSYFTAVTLAEQWYSEINRENG